MAAAAAAADAAVAPGDVPSNARLAAVQAANPECADCGAPRPDWASLSLGVTLCIACSGVHRSLGVSVSKVRSMVLDSWDEAGVLALEAVGNEPANAAWQARLPDGWQPLRPSAQRADRQRFIEAKYKWRGFTVPAPEDELAALVAPEAAARIVAAVSVSKAEGPTGGAAQESETSSGRAARRAAAMEALAGQALVLLAARGDSPGVSRCLAWGAAPGSVGLPETAEASGGAVRPGDSAVGAAARAGHASCVAQLLLCNAAVGEAERAAAEQGGDAAVAALLA